MTIELDRTRVLLTDASSEALCARRLSGPPMRATVPSTRGPQRGNTGMVSSEAGGSGLTEAPSIDSSGSPPREPSQLAAWFHEGVAAEIAHLEKAGGSQKFELLTGKLLEVTGPSEAIYQFVIADGTRLPEDAEGRLKALGKEFRASVINQQANRVQLLVETDSAPPPGITNAVLFVDDTALLRRLAEVLEKQANASSPFGPLATIPFHPLTATVGYEDVPDVPQLVTIESETRRVLEQASGSSLTYVWGPPGTGKTFTIARLIAALVYRGERVLLTSHTHAAIDKALYETVSPEASGPLAANAVVSEGRVLRVGRTSDPKIPDDVRLDKVLERESAGLQARISELQVEAKPLSEERGRARAQLAQWARFDDVERTLATQQRRRSKSESEGARLQAELSKGTAELDRQRTGLEQAQRAWMGRKRKVERAVSQVQEATERLSSDERRLALASREIGQASAGLRELEAVIVELRESCRQLPDRSSLQQQMSALEGQLRGIEARIQPLQAELSNLQDRLMAEALVICCTLTKNYVGRELSGQSFDAVIVDEVSMALPPLLFLAANRATRRVVLVGDFFQLPPVVRSDSEISDSRLRRDAFHLAGIVDGNHLVSGSALLTKLTTQRRMVPPIADAARHLAYGPDGIHDHTSVLDRVPPDWLDFLPDSPLLVVDTADLRCWSGKQPGSLSRFNFYSATLAVELAGMAAARIPQPPLEEPPPIGIATPYAAQRRLLARLVRDLDLTAWVLAGTVHTFQGSEAPLVIFDSVLDEPYWSARLCNPKATADVIRELNVAVTRARDKLVFIGSSEWLNKCAKPSSGLGQLWQFLKDRAELVSATELVEDGFLQRVAGDTPWPEGWRLPSLGDEPVHEILDEDTFFDRFSYDMAAASQSVFGLVPFFGEYRWPRVQPLFAAALSRGVEVTLVVPPSEEARNASYVESAVANLRDMGAVVVLGSGLHGKDIVIDQRVHYTGSLNWASHRGRREIMHRTDSPALAKLVLQYLQARYIRSAGVHEDGSPRRCPVCGGQTQVVNQRRQHWNWDKQAMKVGCANPYCQKYLRNVDERPPFREVPVCSIDGRTRCRRVKRGKGEVWECPKHPKTCPREKVVPGDPG
jgi:hypothetical protein